MAILRKAHGVPANSNLYSGTKSSAYDEPIFATLHLEGHLRMRNRIRIFVIPAIAFASLVMTGTKSGAADYANTAWTPSAVVSTTGSGTLNAIAVTIGTAAAGDNYGKTFDQDWDTIGFVNAAGFTNVTPSGGIALGYTANTSTTQNITFGGAGITNPYYLVNWTESGTSITFPQTPTFFYGSQANLVGNVVTITASESAEVGFIAGFTGTFNSLNFIVNRTGGNETLAFTVAAVPVPEPSTWALGGLSVLAMAAAARRRRRNMA